MLLTYLLLLLLGVASTYARFIPVATLGTLLPARDTIQIYHAINNQPDSQPLVVGVVHSMSGAKGSEGDRSVQQHRAKHSVEHLTGSLESNTTSVPPTFTPHAHRSLARNLAAQTEWENAA